MNAATLPILIAVAGLTYLQYLWGRRLNLAIIQGSAQELEKALSPKEQTYTWIGGFIGYKADYLIRRGHLYRVEATLTALPRHSLLYLPISWLWRRYDHLYLLLRPNQPVRGRAHLFRSGPGVPAPRIADVQELKREEQVLGGHRYTLLYSSETAARLLRHLAQAVQSHSGQDVALLRHLSINAEEGAVYCLLVPRLGQIGPAVRGLAQAVAEL